VVRYVGGGLSQIVSTSNGRCVSTGLPDGDVSRVRGLDKVKYPGLITVNMRISLELSDDG
jgi:hypothetical protein